MGIFDLRRLQGLTPGATYEITATAVGDGINYSDSDQSAPPLSYTFMGEPPKIGSAIRMNLGSSMGTAAGTPNAYRVLNVTRSGPDADIIAEVVALYDLDTNFQFNPSSAANITQYNESALDNYLNNTWYNSLSTVAKSAIVDKQIAQESWYWNYDRAVSPIIGYYGPENPGDTEYTISRANGGSETFVRHCYALSVGEVANYITKTVATDGMLQNYNIWKMFWNTEDGSGVTTYPWLRTLDASGGGVWYAGCSVGNLFVASPAEHFAARPAFQINLTHMAWSQI